MKNIFKILLTSLVISGAAQLHAACIVRNSDGQPTSVKEDPLFIVLQKTDGCPKNVQSLKESLIQVGLLVQPYMVANRGIHNPTLGSFSFFEQVTGTTSLLKTPVHNGEFFFGHFTTVEKNQIVADQEPTKGKLLIELIAWDNSKFSSSQSTEFVNENSTGIGQC